MPGHSPLLRILSDGKFRSGEQLGAVLGISRSGVWKQIRVLEALGVEVHAVPGRGYRLAQPLELLSSQGVLSRLGESSRHLLSGLEILLEVDSTNTHLLRRAAEGAPRGLACLAELQWAGRGRRGRSWVSPFGRNLYLSLLWRFEAGPEQLSGLSLVAGVVAIEALAHTGVSGCGLKWPNDLVAGGRKLGGILIDLLGEAGTSSTAVIGVGVNLDLPAGGAAAIDQPWTDVRSLLGGRGPSRHELAAALLDRLLLACEGFVERGFRAYRDAWLAHDVHLNRPIVLHTPQGPVHGVARGVDARGGLLLGREGRVESFTAGEVSLREAEGQEPTAPDAAVQGTQAGSRAGGPA